MAAVSRIGSLVGAAVIAGFSSSSAQSKTATISGRVVAASREPIPGARITVLNLRKSIATDSAGRFAFPELKPGSYRLEAAVIGFVPMAALVTVNAGDLKDIEFRTDSLGQLLPTIFVEGEPLPEVLRPTTVFERRMAVGHGRFITRDRILQRKPQKIMDMIRFEPGVKSDCRGFVCSLRLNRDTRITCGPAIFVDGQETNIQVLDNTPPNDIEGVEIYRGPAEVPPEINTPTARCGGAIALWTRRGTSP